MAEITLSGVTRNLSKANEYLLGWWRDQRLSEDKRFDFELVLEELFINAVTHGDLQRNASRVVQISLEVEKKPQTAKGDEVRRCSARLPRGLRTSAKPTNNNLVTRGPTRLPTLPRPQRCGLTRVCSAATEADVIVVIQVTLKR